MCCLNYDGSLIFDTKIDRSGFEAGINTLKSSAIAGGAAITAALGTVVGASVKFGSEFEQSLAKASTLFGEVEVDVVKLKKNMLGLSGATGVAATELNEALYSALSASIPASEDMSEALGVLETSTKLSKAGFTDIDTALSATAKTLNAYGLDVSETERIQGILIQTQNKGITTVGELGASLSQVTPTAAAFCVSFENVGAALATMTAQGTTTAQATTQLNSLIAELGKSGTVASKNLQKATKGTKYAGKSFNDIMKSGASLKDVLALMSKQADKNGLSMVDMFSSIEAGKAALSLMNKEGKTFTQNLETMSDTAGIVDEAYEKVTDTLPAKMQILGESAKNLGITFYNGIEEPLKDAADAASAAISEVASSMNSGELENSISNIGSLVADVVSSISSAVSTAVPLVINGLSGVANTLDVVSPLLPVVAAGFVTYKASVTAAQVATALFNTTLLSNPIGLTIAGVTALAAGFVVVKSAISNAETAYYNIGKTIEESGNKFEDAKTKAELTSEHVTQWQELKNAIQQGKVPTEELAAAEAKVKEHEQWFIDNYEDYISAEEKKNGIRAETAKSLKEIANAMNETAKLELESSIVGSYSDIQKLKTEIPELETKNKVLTEQKNEYLGIQIALQKANNEYQSWINAQENVFYSYEEEQKVLSDIISSYEELGKLSEEDYLGLLTTGDFTRNLVNIKDDIKNINNEIVDNSEKISSAKLSVEQFEAGVRSLAEVSIGDFSVDKASQAFKILSSALSEVKEKSELTDQTVEELTQLFPELNKNSDLSTLKKEMDSLKENVKKAKDEVLLLGIDIEDVPKDIQTLISIVLSEDSISPENAAAGGQEIARIFNTNVAKGIQENSDEISTTATDVIEDVNVEAGKETEKSKGLGNDWGQGYADGIIEKIPVIETAGATAAAAASSAAQAEQDSSSPAKESMYLGNDWGDGYVIGIESKTSDAALAARNVVNSAIDGAESAASEGQFNIISKKLTEQLATGIETAEEKLKDAFYKEKNVIDKLLDYSVISEKEYYSKLANLRSKHFKTGTAEWYEYTEEVSDGNAKLIREQIDNIESGYQEEYDINKKFHDSELIDDVIFYSERINRYKEYIKQVIENTELMEKDKREIISDYEEQIKNDMISSADIMQLKANEIKSELNSAADSIEQKQSQISDKLKGYGELYYQYNLPEYEIDGSVIKPTITKLADISEQNKSLQEYYELISKLKERANIPEELLTEIYNMPVTEAVAYIKALLNAEDKSFGEYINNWIQKQKLSDNIAKALTADDTTRLKEALSEKYGELSTEFLSFGEKSAEQYGNGFKAALSEVFDDIGEQINLVMEKLLPQSISSIPGMGSSYNSYTDSRTTNIYAQGNSPRDILEAQKNAEVYQEHTKSW